MDATIEWSTKVGEHPDMLVAVIDPEGDYGFVVNPDAELRDWIDGHCLADVSQCDNFPQEQGFYVCTIERHFEQGWSEGYRADGESDYWLVLSDIRRVDVTPYLTQTLVAKQ